MKWNTKHNPGTFEEYCSHRREVEDRASGHIPRPDVNIAPCGCPWVVIVAGGDCFCIAAEEALAAELAAEEAGQGEQKETTTSTWTGTAYTDSGAEDLADDPGF